MKRGYLIRGESKEQTLGHLFVFDEGHNIVFSCCTLELAWRNNDPNVSSIPLGEYQVASRWSHKYKNHFHVLDVPGRSMILFHAGNHAAGEVLHTRGCILVGKAHTDINADGHRDVISSRTAMREMIEALPPTWILKVID